MRRASPARWRGTRPPSRPAHILHDCEDVALGVLEPRRSGTAGGGDAVDGLHAPHIVFLERDAAGLQLGTLALDIGHLPVRLAGSIGSGVLRRIEEAGRAVGELIDDAPGDFAGRTKSDGLL